MVRQIRARPNCSICGQLMFECERGVAQWDLPVEFVCLDFECLDFGINKAASTRPNGRDPSAARDASFLD